MVRGAQRNIGIPADEPQEEPDLFLSTVAAAPFALDPLNRHIVTQPVLGPTEDGNMFRQQSHLFVEFPVHGLLRRFTALDAALRKLPGMFPDSFAPENLVFRVT